ncbi:hypothetical protein PG993_002314 [Apiospora rasikravindrae]|uniref:Cytochrome P450 n=1 Tax=Apiospora rasikravindrae TaxID=990691 RepID=A0ABR1TZ21_9PEZI
MYNWHFVNRFTVIDDEAGQLPPQYPFLVPYVGNALSFIWDSAGLARRVGCYYGKLTSSRISFLGFEIFVFQDRKTIARIWKQSTLSSPISMFVYVLKYFFGLPEKVVSVYRTDNSGPFPKRYAGSTVPAQDRIDHITHHGFLRALSGPGLLPTTKRYMHALSARIDDRHFSEDWTEMKDFSSFFRDLVGSSLIECLFGPTMLHLNPSFMQDLWGFDMSVPWLARGVPSFLRPSAYTPRERCVGQLKRWYAYARERFDESLVDADGDGDPFWGSNLMRYRQDNLLLVKNHDDDALARMDLGLAWGAVGNTIPCAMLSALHIFKDPELLERIRADVENSFGDQPLLGFDPQRLNKEPLLSSVYAEVLRLYVKTYFMVSSPHKSVHVGKWCLPKGRIGLMNAGVSHMDDFFWNSYADEHPVTSFWADRFIIDPADPLSGPAAPHVRESPDWVEPRPSDDNVTQAGKRPFFSMDGTEGSWFPYGGGHSICPGRFLAKSVVLFTCALLAQQYDIQILSDRLEFGSWRFGLGVGALKHAVPFRIRKRNLSS